jgi:hypothetical protein
MPTIWRPDSLGGRVGAYIRGMVEDSGSRAGELAKSGIRIGAAAAGGYLGTILGPDGGSGAGQALSEVGESLVVYVIDRRQKDRVAGVLQRSVEQIEARRDAGEEVREEIDDLGREDAAAVFESVVDAAARSFEGKKAEAIANFYAEVAFDESVSIADALLYLRRMRDCSWRQLLSLCFFESDDRREERELVSVSLAEGDAHIHSTLEDELQEMLRAFRLLGVEAKDGRVNDPSDIYGGSTALTRIGNIRPTSLGSAIVRLSRLEEFVTDDELDEVAVDLHRQ